MLRLSARSAGVRDVLAVVHATLRHCGACRDGSENGLYVAYPLTNSGPVPEVEYAMRTPSALVQKRICCVGVGIALLLR